MQTIIEVPSTGEQRIGSENGNVIEMTKIPNADDVFSQAQGPFVQQATPPNQSPKGLSSDEANSVFLRVANETLNSKSSKYRDGNVLILEYLKKVHIWITLISAIVLLCGYYYGYTPILVEGLCILLVLIFNGGLVMREYRLAATEMPVRLQDALDLVQKYGISKQDDIHFNDLSTPTIQITRVLRDDSIRLVPCNMLAKDDIVLLGLGDKAPVKCQYILQQNAKESILERDRILKPSFFKALGLGEFDSRENSNGRIYELAKFIVLETPIKDIINSALEFQTRPSTITTQYMYIIESVYGKYLILFFLILSLAVNIGRVYLVESPQRSGEFWFTMLARMPICTILPILPVAFPTVMLVSRGYSNAYILTLFEALLSSKTEFEDNEDVDEFDAAPAPTKEFTLPWTAIARSFLDQIIKLDGTHLVRMTGLIESLANTTVLCAIDREGTISSPLPALDQLVLLDEAGDPVILDLNYDTEAPNGVRFEDNDWQSRLKMLKPFGLSSILSTDCGVINGRRRNDLHFKSSTMPAHACPMNSRLVCMCHVGREIGFNPKVFSQSLSHALSIETLQPPRDDPANETTDVYHYDIPGITSRVVGEIRGEGPFQVFSEGSLELVIESCGDYWNGSQLGTFNESIERKVYEFATNALISDLQVVGFSYRPIQNPSLWSQIRTLMRKDPYYIYLSPLVNTASKTLVGASFTESPVKQSTTDTIPPISAASSPHTATSSFKLKKRGNLDRLVSKIDSQAQVQLHEQEICRELTKSQTFLCAASFVYPPKPNMVDFVEDLGLAGIRFVYFSAAPERESKAYAERLGLEIDWNSCIILSPDNGNGKGYLALHDMKAQLPRGVETIRGHIRDVDDVPLHVSLFAESKPATIREMCKIFQENGEVVCCIGSSLNDLNIECFVNADISIAIDPIPLHRRKMGYGPLSPLIVSSLMNASPCALTLNADSSLYSITQMIREARSLSENGRQAFSFYIGVQIGLSCVIFLGFCTLLPLVMEGYQIMWIVWVITPMQSCSILFTPHLPDIMTHIPAKNTGHWKDAPKFAIYYTIRFCLFPVFLCITLLLFMDVPAAMHAPLSLPWYLVPTNSTDSLVLFIQNYVALVFVVQMVLISGTFIHRTVSVVQKSPFTNRVWTMTSLISIILQLAFMSVSLSTVNGFSYVHGMKWWMHVVCFAGVFVNIPIQEAVKADDRKKWILFQKRTKLEFNTKLGMHSPL